MKNRNPKLVSAKVLLEKCFDSDCRPSERWLRDLQSKRLIPHYKIGGSVFFDCEEVFNLLETKFKVKGLHDE